MMSVRVLLILLIVVVVDENDDDDDDDDDDDLVLMNRFTRSAKDCVQMSSSAKSILVCDYFLFFYSDSFWFKLRV